MQAESSTCMYSLHGFDALIRPEFGAGVPLVDRRVVLDARVGAAPRGLGDLAHQLARGIGSPIGSPVVRAIRCQSSSFSTALMNSSVTRTELLAFWYWIE